MANKHGTSRNTYSIIKSLDELSLTNSSPFFMAVRELNELKPKTLPTFETPVSLKTLLENNFKCKSTFGPQELELLDKVERSSGRFVQSSEPYRQQLTLLNQIEDEHLSQLFASYTVDNPKLLRDRSGPNYSNFLYNLSVSQFKQQPVLLAQYTEVHVFIKRGTNDYAFQGYVDQVTNEFVSIKMERNISSDQIVKIEFRVDRTVFRLEYRALELLDETVIKKMFFPDSIEPSEPNKFKFQWFRESVASNKEQKTAIKNIVNRTSYPAPYILFGPPGTGKTTTLVESICQIYKLKPWSHILVATASNSAANEIVERLLKFIPHNDIYRFYAKSCERNQGDLNANILSNSNYSDGFYRNPCYDDIYQSRVVVCTLTTAGRLAQANISDKHFEYIFIDECGSAKEVSVLVAIAGIGAKYKDINAQVVLAGDPNQLGPVVKYEFLKRTSHSISMLERLMNREFYRKGISGYNTNVITQLRDNFRSHEVLLHFSNFLFYDNQLRAKAPEDVANFAIGWPCLPNRCFPIMLHPIDGQIRTDSSSTSIYNQEEAYQIIHYLQTILESGVNGRHVKQSDIGVLSPYARQVNYLRTLCDERGWNEVEIGSTEQYQGREKLIMLISTARSRCPTIGFLGDAKRLNVALTRARALLIVVGNPETLEKDTHWNTFIQFCRVNRAIVECRNGRANFAYKINYNNFIVRK